MGTLLPAAGPVKPGLRLRLEFAAGATSQRIEQEGLQKCWYTTRRANTTGGDVLEEIVDSFGLTEAAAVGLKLVVRGYALPRLESAAFLRADDDVIVAPVAPPEPIGNPPALGLSRGAELPHLELTPQFLEFANAAAEGLARSEGLPQLNGRQLIDVMEGRAALPSRAKRKRAGAEDSGKAEAAGDQPKRLRLHGELPPTSVAPRSHNAAIPEAPAQSARSGQAPVQDAPEAVPDQATGGPEKKRSRSAARKALKRRLIREGVLPRVPKRKKGAAGKLPADGAAAHGPETGAQAAPPPAIPAPTATPYPTQPPVPPSQPAAPMGSAPALPKPSAPTKPSAPAKPPPPATAIPALAAPDRDLQRGPGWGGRTGKRSKLGQDHIYFPDSDREDEAADGGAEGGKLQMEVDEEEAGTVVAASGRVLEEPAQPQAREGRTSSLIGGMHLTRVSDFRSLPSLEGPPAVGDILAYKLLEIGADWAPRVSEFRRGRVTAVEGPSVTLEPWPQRSGHSMPNQAPAAADEEESEEEEGPPSSYDEFGILVCELSAFAELRVLHRPTPDQAMALLRPDQAPASATNIGDTAMAEAASPIRTAATDVGKPNQALSAIHDQPARRIGTGGQGAERPRPKVEEELKQAAQAEAAGGYTHREPVKEGAAGPVAEDVYSQYWRLQGELRGKYLQDVQRVIKVLEAKTDRPASSQLPSLTSALARLSETRHSPERAITADELAKLHRMAERLEPYLQKMLPKLDSRGERMPKNVEVSGKSFESSEIEAREELGGRGAHPVDLEGTAAVAAAVPAAPKQAPAGLCAPIQATSRHAASAMPIGQAVAAPPTQAAIFAELAAAMQRRRAEIAAADAAKKLAAAEARAEALVAEAEAAAAEAEAAEAEAEAQAVRAKASAAAAQRAAQRAMLEANGELSSSSEESSGDSEGEHSSSSSPRSSSSEPPHSSPVVGEKGEPRPIEESTSDSRSDSDADSEPPHPSPPHPSPLPGKEHPASAMEESTSDSDSDSDSDADSDPPQPSPVPEKEHHASVMKESTSDSGSDKDKDSEPPHPSPLPGKEHPASAMEESTSDSGSDSDSDADSDPPQPSPVPEKEHDASAMEESTSDSGSDSEGDSKPVSETKPEPKSDSESQSDSESSESESGSESEPETGPGAEEGTGIGQAGSQGDAAVAHTDHPQPSQGHRFPSPARSGARGLEAVPPESPQQDGTQQEAATSAAASPGVTGVTESGSSAGATARMASSGAALPAAAARHDSAAKAAPEDSNGAARGGRKGRGGAHIVFQSPKPEKAGLVGRREPHNSPPGLLPDGRTSGLAVQQPQSVQRSLHRSFANAGLSTPAVMPAPPAGMPNTAPGNVGGQPPGFGAPGQPGQAQSVPNGTARGGGGRMGRGRGGQGPRPRPGVRAMALGPLLARLRES